MNFAVGFVILFCLFCSEYSAVGAAGHLQARIGGIALLTCLVPGLALLQTYLVSRKVQRQEIDKTQWERICRRVSSCHTAVWLAASVATIYAFRWHDVVRAEWGLDRFVLIDEILILAPVLLSLLASWAVFFDMKPNIQSALPAEEKSTTLSWSIGRLRAWLFSTERRAFVSIRFRLYVLVLVLPLLLAIAVSDLVPTFLRLGPYAVAVLVVVGGFGTLALLPTLAGLPWKLAAPDDNVASLVGQELDQFQLVRPSVRVWKTGNQIINAGAVGMLPWFRQLWISDRLIDLFAQPELKAIVRHEVAHLQLGHAAIRSLLLLMPVAIVSITGWLCWGDPLAVDAIAGSIGVSSLVAAAIMLALYLIYAVVTLWKVSHAFEFEADMIACCKPLDQQDKVGARNRLQICQQRLAAMEATIDRLAVCMPAQIDKKSLMHPSLRARMKALQRLRFWAGRRSPDQLISSNRWWSFGAAGVVASSIAFVIWALSVSAVAG